MISALDMKTSRILLVLVVALHAGLAIAIKFTFFAATPRKQEAPEV